MAGRCRNCWWKPPSAGSSSPISPSEPRGSGPRYRAAGANHDAQAVSSGRHGRRNPQACLLIAFLMAPIIAVRMAPPAPPPTSCPITEPMSAPPLVAPWRAGMSCARSCLPPNPPRAPAMVLPTVPRLMFFIPDPAALPPMIPAMSWIMMLMMVADTGVLLALGHLLAASSAGTAAHRPYMEALYLDLLTIHSVQCAPRSSPQG